MDMYGLSGDGKGISLKNWEMYLEYNKTKKGTSMWNGKNYATRQSCAFETQGNNIIITTATTLTSTTAI